MLVSLTALELNNLSRLLSASAVTAVTYGVIALFVFTILFFLILVIARLVVSRREKAFERKKEEIQPLLYELLSSEREPYDIVATLKSVIPERDRGVLEHLLLEYGKVLKGKERTVLALVFEEMGFVDEDIAGLKSKDPIRRAESAFHLGTMRSERATPHLIEALSSSSPEVTFACLNALSKIGNARAIEAVMDYLASGSELETLRVAEVILEKKQSFSPYLERWLEGGGPDAGTTLLTIDLIGATKDADAVPLLLKYLDDPDPELRRHVARALGSIADATACTPLIESMDDDSASVRATSADALGNIQCDEATDRLERGLYDPDLKVKINCAAALSRLGEPGHRALERGLRAEEEDRRTIVEEVLSRERLDEDRREV